jgi:hypothetical protein
MAAGGVLLAGCSLIVGDPHGNRVFPGNDASDADAAPADDGAGPDVSDGHADAVPESSVPDGFGVDAVAVADTGATDATNMGEAAAADSGASDADAMAPAESGAPDASDGGCPATTSLCGGSCVNTQTDNNNCGACGTVCSASEDQFCHAGQCGSECGGTFSTSYGVCSNLGLCVNFTNTNVDCGGCGTDCTTSEPGSVCANSACSCPAGTTLVGKNCLQGGVVALPRTGWTVSASLDSGTASSAIDGSECTRWMTGVGQAAGQTFTLNMGSAYKFSQIQIDNTNDPNDYPGSYAVYASSDGLTWGSAIANGNGSGPVTTVSFPEQNAQYIEIQITSNANANWWSLDEIRVYSAHPPVGTPIPRVQTGWTATASVGATTAAQGIDGNLTTYFNTNQNQLAGMVYQVNMGAPATISQITLDNYDLCNINYPNSYAVYVSNDGVNWGSAVATVLAGSQLSIATFPPVIAQYVKVQLSGANGQWWNIAEMNIYSPSD